MSILFILIVILMSPLITYWHGYRKGWGAGWEEGWSDGWEDGYDKITANESERRKKMMGKKTYFLSPDIADTYRRTNQGVTR